MNYTPHNGSTTNGWNIEARAVDITCPHLSVMFHFMDTIFNGVSWQ